MRNNSFTSIGIGLTNSCNLNCRHCYSRAMKNENLTAVDIKDILKKFPKVKAVNLGTGESILNKDFREILILLKEKGIKVGLTTNGLTVKLLEDKYLNLIDEYDISLDFPHAKKHDDFRGVKGTYESAIAAIDKLTKMGKEVSIALALTSENYKYINKFKNIIDRYDIPLRINIYKPVNNDKLTLSYNQFWGAMRDISKKYEIVSCSEPVLSLVYDNEVKGSPCGNSLRVHPDKSISGCVYLEEEVISFDDFNNLKKETPSFCRECEIIDSCRGGCMGRRILENRVKIPDSYCPRYLNKKIPKIHFSKYQGNNNSYIHSSYLCTLIIR